MKTFVTGSLAAVVLALATALTSVPAAGQAPKPDFSLRGAADAAASKKANTFGGTLTLTSDGDWRRQWVDAKGSVPRFTEVTSISRGKKFWVLVFFSGARPDRLGQVNVECDLRFLRPDGTTAHEQKGLPCYKGHIEGAPDNLRLATQQIEFMGEPKDPPGTWRVEVKLRDENAKSEVPLIAVFTLRS